MVETIFLVIGGAAAIYYGALWVRDFYKTRNNAAWPSVDATVQRGQGGPGDNNRLAYRSIFGYVFTVGSNQYVGTFVLVQHSEQRADELQRKLDGVRIRIRYNSESPETSLVESLPGELASFEVKQGSDWVDYDGGEVIGLNL